MKNKKVIIFIFLFGGLAFMFLSSDTGVHELKDLALVSAIAIDIEDDNIILTCEVSNPRYSKEADGASSASFSIVFVQGKGKTLIEAIKNTSLHFDRELFFSHANVLIIGEELAKTGIIQYLDYFSRSQEPRENVKIVVAKEIKAYEVIGIMGDLSPSGGIYISKLLDKSKDNSKSINISLAEYFRYYYDIGNEPVIGVVENITRLVIDGEEERIGPKKTILTVGGGAVTKRDSLIGYFSPEEMIGFNFIVDDIQGGIITIITPEDLNTDISIIGNEGKFTSVEVLKSKTKKDIKIQNGKIHLDINVKLRASLIEEHKAVDLDDEEILEILEDSCSREIEKLVSQTLNKGQKKFKQDNFSIGRVVHKKHPKLWGKIGKEWNDIFPEITYSVKAETEITKMGFINRPSNLRKGR